MVINSGLLSVSHALRPWARSGAYLSCGLWCLFNELDQIWWAKLSQACQLLCSRLQALMEMRLGQPVRAKLASRSGYFSCSLELSNRAWVGQLWNASRVDRFFLHCCSFNGVSSGLTHKRHCRANQEMNWGGPTQAQPAQAWLCGRELDSSWTPCRYAKELVPGNRCTSQRCRRCVIRGVRVDAR